jgi:hypothetical protein
MLTVPLQATTLLQNSGSALPPLSLAGSALPHPVAEILDTGSKGNYPEGAFGKTRDEALGQ